MTSPRALPQGVPALFVTLLAGMLVAGCAPGRVPTSTPSPRVEVRTAPQEEPVREPAHESPAPPADAGEEPGGKEISISEAFAAGRYERVVEEFEKIRQLYPAYMMGADDLYYLGMSQYYLEDADKAIRAFLEFQYRFSQDPRVAAVHLMAARTFRRMGKEGRALDSLLMAVHFAGDDGIRMQAWEEKADILASQGRWLDALSVMDEAYLKVGPERRNQVQTRIMELLLVMPGDLVEGPVMRGSYSFPRQTVEAVAARNRRSRGEVSSLAAQGADRDEPAAMSLPPGERPLLRIGVLTPGGERLQAYGEEVRRGTELALAQRTGDGYPFRLEAVHVDEESLREGGSEVQSLFEDEKVVAVIGPVLSSSVERIMPQAERSGLPVFSPTASSPRLNGISPNFFRNCLTIDQLGRGLAVLAMERLGLATFALFAPDDMYGLRFSEAFRAAVRLRGGLIIASETYGPDLTDFAGPIRKLKAQAGIPDEPPEKAERQEGGEPEEIPLPFDGIFVPGTAEEVGLILPQLTFHDIDVKDLVVLGGSGLNTGRLPEVGEEYAEGVFFADGFLAGSPRREVQEFVRLFQQRYDALPGTFAAQAYDAAAIVIDLASQGASDRSRMLAALGRVRGFPGVTGSTSLAGGGIHERQAFIGTVLGGHLVPVEFEDAPAADPVPEPVPQGVLP